MLSLWKKARRWLAQEIAQELEDQGRLARPVRVVLPDSAQPEPGWLADSKAQGRKEVGELERWTEALIKNALLSAASPLSQPRAVAPRFVSPGLGIEQESYLRQDGSWHTRLRVTWPEVPGPCRVELRQAGQLIETRVVREPMWVTPGLDAGKRYEVAVIPEMTWQGSLTVTHHLGEKGMH